MDEHLLMLTGVILQVLELHVAIFGTLLGAVIGLVSWLVPKDELRSSSEEDEPKQQ